MGKAIKIGILAVIVVIAVIIGFSAKRSDKKIATGPQTFYYYPKANVYYDVTDGKYLQLSPDGTTWQASTLSADDQKTLGKNVVLDSSLQPVWQNNEQHRMVYAAALYATPSDYQDALKNEQESKADQATQKKQVTKKRVSAKKQKQKNGVGKFFERIFDGNKKSKG